MAEAGDKRRAFDLKSPTYSNSIIVGREVEQNFFSSAAIARLSSSSSIEFEPPSSVRGSPASSAVSSESDLDTTLYSATDPHLTSTPHKQVVSAQSGNEDLLLPGAAAETDRPPTKKRRKTAAQRMAAADYDEEDSDLSSTSNAPAIRLDASNEMVAEDEALPPPPPLGLEPWLSSDELPPTRAPWARHSESRGTSSRKRLGPRANLQGLPPPTPFEGTLIVENFVAMRSSGRLDEKIFSEVLNIGDDFKARLMLFPMGTSQSKNPAVFIEVSPPVLKDEESLLCWRYPDLSYYICLIDWEDWSCSKWNQDRFTFSNKDSDRGWHNFIALEDIESKLGPNDELYFRFACFPRGAQFATAETQQYHRGLKNHGTTCYLNSVLQCLFHLGDFCKSIYAMTFEEDNNLLMQNCSPGDGSPEGSVAGSDTDGGNSKSWTEEEIAMALDETGPGTGGSLTGPVDGILPDSASADASPSIARALQRVFFDLSLCGRNRGDCHQDVSTPVDCRELIRSFGWDTADQFTQHDAQELNRLLCDRLEDKMKNTPSDGTIKRLFAGESQVYIECTEVDYKSQRSEVFYDLQLDVKDLPNLSASLNEYVKEELLDGDNCYQAEGYGPQPARKGTRFLTLPPVLQFHLKRFQFDLHSMDMVKVNDKFEFPEIISLDPWCPNAGTYRLFAVDVHSGDVHEGHYYAFVRWPKQSAAEPGDDSMKDCNWYKFDDEAVWRCNETLAIQQNYGGSLDLMTSPYLADRYADETSLPLATKRSYSAYILFYVKDSMARQLLPPPDSRVVNPGMVLRFKLKDRLWRKQLRIRRDLELYLKVHLVTEQDLLLRPKGVWRDFASLPVRKTLKRARDTSAFEFWKEIKKMIEDGELGEDLQKQYVEDASTRPCVPGLFYMDYYSPDSAIPRGELVTAKASGWCETYCRRNEIGPGVRLWFLEMKEPSTSTRIGQASTLQTNFGYLYADAIDRKHPSLYILIHPLTLGPKEETANLKPSKIIQLHETRTIFPLKVFDTMTNSIVDQDSYFLGIVDLTDAKGGRPTGSSSGVSSRLYGSPEPTVSISEIHSIVARKITQTWERHSTSLRSHMCPGSRLHERLDKLCASMAHSESLTRSQLLDLSWHLYIENRGYYELCTIRDFVKHCDSRVIVVCFPPEDEFHDDIAAEKELVKARMDSIQVALPEVCSTDAYPVDEITFFAGAPTPIPSIVPEFPTLPAVPKPAQNSPPEWLSGLRSVRRVIIHLGDLPQYFGRFETLEGNVRTSELSANRDDDLNRSETAGSVDSSDLDTSVSNGLRTIVRVETEIDLSWRLGFFVLWISMSVLRIDPQYLWIFFNEPLNSSDEDKAVLQLDDRDHYRETMDDPVGFHVLLKRQDVFASRVFSTFALNQNRYGSLKALSAACASPVNEEPPVMYLALSPRKTALWSPVRGGKMALVRVFDPAVGVLGCVLADGLGDSDTVEALIQRVKTRIDVNVIRSRMSCTLEEARGWLSQEFDLVEHSAYALRRAQPAYETSKLLLCQHASVLVLFVRIEPKLRWFGEPPVNQTAKLAALDILFVDEETMIPFGTPFTFLIAAYETWESIKSRLIQQVGCGDHGLSTRGKFYKTEQRGFKQDGRRILLKERDVIFTPSDFETSQFMKSGSQYSPAPCHLLIVMSHPTLKRKSGRPGTVSSSRSELSGAMHAFSRRRHNPTLHIKG